MIKVRIYYNNPVRDDRDIVLKDSAPETLKSKVEDHLFAEGDHVWVRWEPLTLEK
jgi:hypothetical protein